MPKFLLSFGFILLFVVLFKTTKGQTITTGTVSGTIVSCAGSASSGSALQQFTVAGTGLTGNIFATAPAGFELSLAANGSYNTSIAMVQGAGAVNGTIYVRASSTAATGTITGDVVLTSNGAAGKNVSVNATVNSVLTANPVANQVVTHADLVASIALSGNAASYKWEIDNPNIGLPANGVGDLPSFTAINTGSTVITATVKVTPSSPGFIYITDGSLNNVTVINSATNTVVATIPVGANSFKPVVSHDGKKVYIASIDTKSIYVLDAFANKVSAIILINRDVSSLITLSPDDSRLYVPNPLANSVVVVNTATNTIIGPIQGFNYPVLAETSNDGKVLFVTNFGNGLNFVNTSTNQIENTLIGLGGGLSMVKSTDGSRLYVVTNTSRIAVVDIHLRQIKGYINIDPATSKAVLSPDGKRLYIANTMLGVVTVINTADNSVVTDINTGVYVADVVIRPDGKFVYALNRNSKTVSVINTADNTIAATISLGGAIGLLAMSPDGSRVYISDNDTKSMFVINTATNTLLTSIPTGTDPNVFNTSITDNNGCITQTSFTIKVNPSPTALPPAITPLNAPRPLTTTFGKASLSANFNISANGLTSGILVTPPAGFEVSIDDINFATTVTINGGSDITNMPIYIRLSGTTNAGDNYTGDIVLTSTGAPTAIVLMPVSVVSKAMLTISAVSSAKTYGETFVTKTSAGDFTVPAGALKNGNKIDDVTITYAGGANATDPVQPYANSVKIISYNTSGGFLESNYTVTLIAARLLVTPAPLTFKMDDVEKVYGSSLVNGTDYTKFTPTGLRNGETVGSVSVKYISGGSTNSPVNIYNAVIEGSVATGGTFKATNYNILGYTKGSLTVKPAVLTIKADNKTKQYKSANPPLTFSYSGFVNGESEAILTTLPVISTTATTQSVTGKYPITITGAVAPNYRIDGQEGVLTITPAPGTALLVPNTFTPNGDGVNDTWLIPDIDGYPSCLVKIYNRYGQAVFTSTGYKIPWDGRTVGANVPNGVYYYTIDLRDTSKPLAGHLSVIR